MGCRLGFNIISTVLFVIWCMDNVLSSWHMQHTLKCCCRYWTLFSTTHRLALLLVVIWAYVFKIENLKRGIALIGSFSMICSVLWVFKLILFIYTSTLFYGTVFFNIGRQYADSAKMFVNINTWPIWSMTNENMPYAANITFCVVMVLGVVRR